MRYDYANSITRCGNKSEDQFQCECSTYTLNPKKIHQEINLNSK